MRKIDRLLYELEWVRFLVEFGRELKNHFDSKTKSINYQLFIERDGAWVLGTSSPPILPKLKSLSLSFCERVK